MARVGEEFPLECPNCGGDIRLTAFIAKPKPFHKILTHLGEPLVTCPPLNGTTPQREKLGARLWSATGAYFRAV